MEQQHCHDARFVDEHRAELIQRVTMVMPLADVLRGKDMLQQEKYSEIRAAKTHQEQMRELFDVLDGGRDRVKSAFYCALKDNDPHLLQDLECNKQRAIPDTPDKTSIIFKYKESILSDYETVLEYNSLPGQYVLLVDRYTELLIIQKPRKQREKEEEIRSTGERFQEVFSTRDSEVYCSTSVDQLFTADASPHPGHSGRVPKAVILQGHSGTGKSFTAQKIMHAWASGTLYAECFDLIFYLKCKELNHSCKEKSVVELLSCDKRFTPVISQILQDSPEKVLFLMDGFDELKFSLDVPSESLPSDPFTPAPPEATLCALLSGHILPASFLLVTTRSTATDRLSKLLNRPHRFTEILGFSEQGVKEYFQRFFKDGQLSYEQVYDSVKANETLFTACFIPVICWIVCTVFKEEDVTTVLGTTTSIFVDFVSTLLKHHCQGLSQPVPTLLRSLGQLAERGMLEQQVLFDLSRESKTVSDPSSIPFLCKFLLKKRISQQTMYSFMHLSFQEFFTALYYTSLDEVEAQNKVRELILNVHRMETKYDLRPVIQFLFGLSNEEVISSLPVTHRPSASLTIRAQLEDWILNLMSSTPSSDSCLFLLHCLYELHEEDFVRKAMEVVEVFCLLFIPLKKTDCWVLRYCLQFCPSIRKLQLCNITAEMLRMLQPALCRCQELCLKLKDLSDVDVGDLTSALGKGKNLMKLSLNGSSLSDQSVQQILSAVSKQKSVGRVHISVKTITSNTAAMFMSLIFNLQNYRSIRLWMDHDMVSDEESLCLSLCVEITDHDFCLSVGEGPSYMQRSSPQAELVLSNIDFFLSNSPEISNINWRMFFQTFHQFKHLTQKCPGFGEYVDYLLSFLHSVPGRKNVFLKVNSLTESCTASVLSLCQACPSLQGIELKVANSMVSDEESVCTSLNVGKTYHGDLRLLVKHKPPYSKIFRPQAPRFREPAISDIQLTFSNSSEISNINWRSFFQTFHQLKCPGFGEHVDDLLSFLHSVPGLKKVLLMVSSLTESWAASVLSLSQASPSLQEIQLRVDKPVISDEESLCTCLHVGKTDHGDFRLHVMHDPPNMQSSSPQAEPALSDIQLIFSKSSEISNINWRSFFQIFHQLKCPGFGEHVDDLLSFLHSVSGLKKVFLEVNSLTESWAAGVLSLSQACPSVQQILLAKADPFVSDEESLCTSLNVGKTYHGDFRLLVKHKPPYSKIFRPQAPRFREPAISDIQLTFSNSSEISNINWRSFFQTFHQLKCPGFGEHVDDLLSFLHSVSGLKEVFLKVNSLTKSWAASVLSLSQACPSLQEIKFLSYRAFLLEEGIQLLQESQKRPDCTLIVKGWRCRKLTDQCTDIKDRKLHCNQDVELQFCGKSFTEKVLDHDSDSEYDTDSDSESETDVLDTK